MRSIIFWEKNHRSCNYCNLCNLCKKIFDICNLFMLCNSPPQSMLWYLPGQHCLVIDLSHQERMMDQLWSKNATKNKIIPCCLFLSVWLKRHSKLDFLANLANQGCFIVRNTISVLFWEDTYDNSFYILLSRRFVSTVYVVCLWSGLQSTLLSCGFVYSLRCLLVVVSTVYIVCLWLFLQSTLLACGCVYSLHCLLVVVSTVYIAYLW